MSKKGLEVTIDELGNIRVSCHNLSSSEAIETLDYARAQVRLNSLKNEETNALRFPVFGHNYPY